MEDLLKARRYHETEARRYRELAEDSIRKAEAHEENCRAYDLVLRDLPVVAGLSDSTGSPLAEVPSNSPPLDVENGNSTPEALIDMVRVAVAQQQGRYMVEDVRKALAAMSPEIAASLRPRAVTKALWRLAQLKEIRQVSAGHGLKPAIYVNRVVKAVEEAPEEE